MSSPSTNRRSLSALRSSSSSCALRDSRSCTRSARKEGISALGSELTPGLGIDQPLEQGKGAATRSQPRTVFSLLEPRPDGATVAVKQVILCDVNRAANEAAFADARVDGTYITRTGTSALQVVVPALRNVR